VVSLLTFSGWLRWPGDQDTDPDDPILPQVRLISTANVIAAIDSGLLKVSKAQRRAVIDQISKIAFDPLEAAVALVKPAVAKQFLVTYDKSMPYLFDAAMVAYFFVRCDETLSPTFNRARFFIERGGFVNDWETGWKDKRWPYKVSESQIKYSWRYFAASSAFTLAAHLLPFKEVLFLPPDREYSSLEAKQVIDRTPALIEYFRFSRAIHECMLERLDHRSRTRVDQFAFPDSIKPTKLVLDPFEDDQLAIINRYSLKKSKPVGQT
jgi:hypothetical protein